jgi:signal transduction histidine kinase
VIYSELGRSSRLQADLEQSRKETAEKLFFLNAISHDLRTPLNGLILHANLAEMVAGANDPAALSDALAQIKTSALGASRMLDSFLEYAQVAASSAPPECTNFQLEEAVRSVVEKFRSSADGKSIALSAKIPEAAQVHLDRFKLERILSNLLDNALKFTRAGSVRVEAQTDGNGLEIHVHDTGSGIAPEHQDKLFDEFFQVHNHARDRAKGFGLGLAIARGLARQLGGDLTVESALGHGSRFTLALPNVVVRADDAATRVQVDRTAAAAIAG